MKTLRLILSSSQPKKFLLQIVSYECLFELVFLGWRMIRMEISNLSFRLWLCNHCHYSLIQGPTNCIINPATGGSTSPTSLNLTATAVLPSLQCILQQNTMQRVRLFSYVLFHVIEIACLKTSFFFFDDCWQEEIIRLIKYLDQTSGNASIFWSSAFSAA